MADETIIFNGLLKTGKIIEELEKVEKRGLTITGSTWAKTRRGAEMKSISVKPTKPVPELGFIQALKIFKIDLWGRWIKGTYNYIAKIVPFIASLGKLFNSMLGLLLTGLILPFLPDILRVITWLFKESVKFFNWTQRRKEEIRDIGGAAGGAIGKLSILKPGFIGNILSKILPEGIRNAFGKVSGVVAKLVGTLTGKITGLVPTIIKKYSGKLFSLIGGIVTRILSPALWVSLVGDIFTIIGNLGKAIFEDSEILTVFFDTIEKGGTFFSELFNVVGWVIAAFKDLTNVFKGDFSMKNLQEKVSTVMEKGGSWIDSIINPRKMAQGGIAYGPTQALIGEGGPEAVIPLNEFGNYGGGGTQITVNGMVDEHKFRAIIRDEISKSNKRVYNNRGAVGL